MFQSIIMCNVRVWLADEDFPLWEFFNYYLKRK